MKYIKLKNVNTDTDCLIGSDNITLLTPPNSKNLGHCHLYFVNGERAVVAKSLGEMCEILTNLGHEITTGNTATGDSKRVVMTQTKAK